MFPRTPIQLLGMLLLASFAIGMKAQPTAIKAVADGHYQGAKQQLTHFLKTNGQTTKGAEDAEALTLVCDYVLGTTGTSERMGEWLNRHPLSQYANPLHVLRRNLQVKEQQVEEALRSFFEEEAAGMRLETPLPYPLTKLSDEIYAYQEVLYRLAGERLYDERQWGRALTYLEAGEKKMMSRVFKFTDLNATDIMIPRLKVICIDPGMSYRDVVQLSERTRISKFPVYENDDIDNIIGVLYVKDMLFFTEVRDEFSVRKVMRPNIREQTEY